LVEEVSVVVVVLGVVLVSVVVVVVLGVVVVVVDGVVIVVPGVAVVLPGVVVDMLVLLPRVPASPPLPVPVPLLLVCAYVNPMALTTAIVAIAEARDLLDFILKLLRFWNGFSQRQ